MLLLCFFVEVIVAFNPLMVGQTSVVEVSLKFYIKNEERRGEECGELIEEVGAMQNEQ